jgi:uncharacterized delta-60 repeat protein
MKILNNSFVFLFLIQIFTLNLYSQPYAGSIDAGFDSEITTNSTINSCFEQGDEKLLIGGFFSSYKGVSTGSCTRLNNDGTLDSAFNVNNEFNGTVNSIITLANQKIIVGGAFTTVNGKSNINIARLTKDGALDTTFQTGAGFNSTVQTILELKNGKLLVGGDFTSFNGVSTNRIVCLLSTGTLDTTFNIGTGLNNTVVDLIEQNDQKILAAGSFNNYNGYSCSGVCRLNENGSIDSSFAIGSGLSNGWSNASVKTMVLQSDQKIVIGGDFSHFNNIASNHLVRIHSDGSLDTTFNSGAGLGTGWGISLKSTAIDSNGKIIIGGAFTSYDGSSLNNLARLNSNGSLDKTVNWGTGPTGLFGLQAMISEVLITKNGLVYAAGDFGLYQDSTRQNIIRLHSGEGCNTISIDVQKACLSYTWIDGMTYTENVDDKTFTTQNSKGCDSIITLNLTINTNAAIDTLVVCDSLIWIDGNTYTKDNHTATFKLVNSFGCDSVVTLHLTVQNSSFSIDTQSARNSYTWKNGIKYYSSTTNVRDTVISSNGCDSIITLQLSIGAGAVDQSFNRGSGADGFVHDVLALNNNKIIIGGSFKNYDNVAVNGIARINTDGTLDTTFKSGLGVDNSIYSLIELCDGKILVGGNFTSFNNNQRNNLVRLNSDGSLDNTFITGQGPDGSVLELVEGPDGKVLIGGGFNSYDGNNSVNIARLDNDGTFDGSFRSIINNSNNTGAVYSIALVDNDKVLVGGIFYEASGKSGFIRINHDGTLDALFNQNGSGPNTTVEKIIELSDKKIMIMGGFDDYNGTSIEKVARLNENGTLDQNFASFAETRSMADMVVQNDGKIVICGEFLSYHNVSSQGLVRLNPNGSIDTTFNVGKGASGPNAWNLLTNLALRNNGDIIIGGIISGFDNVPKNNWAVVYGDEPACYTVLSKPVISMTSTTLTVPSSYNQYAWYRDTTLIEGELSNILEAELVGNYSVTVNDINGCFARSSPVTLLIIGIETSELLGPKALYPNPNNGEFYIKVKGQQPSKLVITNIFGNVVYQSNALSRGTTKINIQHVAPGNYFLTIIGQIKSETYPLSIMK